jgi:hypothetical protein
LALGRIVSPDQESSNYRIKANQTVDMTDALAKFLGFDSGAAQSASVGS